MDQSDSIETGGRFDSTTYHHGRDLRGKFFDADQIVRRDDVAPVRQVDDRLAVDVFEYDGSDRGEMANGSFYSKEAALPAIPGLRAEGKLPTWDEVRARRCVEAARRASRKALAEAQDYFR